MQTFVASLLALLATTAGAAPSPCYPTTSYTTATANYDDLVATGLPSGIPTPYLGLDYTAFRVGLASSSFLTPATGSAFAIAYGVPGALDVDKSVYDAIALKSLAYACDAGIPQPECDIHVVGTNADRAVGVSRTLVFPPQEPGGQEGSYKMLHATFDGAWGNLRELNFSATVGRSRETFNGGLVLDEVIYVGKKVSCEYGH